MVEVKGTTMLLYRIPAGTRFEAHTHPTPELGVVLSGAGQARFGNSVRALEAGDSFYIPSGIVHDFVASGTGPVVMLNVTVPFSPEGNVLLGSESRPAPRAAVAGAPLGRT